MNFEINPIWRDNVVRILYQFGLSRIVRRVSTKLSKQKRIQKAGNKIMIDNLSPALDSIRLQIQSGISKSKGTALLISMDGISNVVTQIPMVAGVVAKGVEPIMLLGSRDNHDQHYLYTQIGIKRFAYWDEFGFSKDFKVPLTQLSRCKTQEDILKIEWRGIAVGKYAVSTLMRRLRAGSINPTNAFMMRHLKAMLRRTIDHSFTAKAILDKFKPETVIFIDRGYTPEGPMFEMCIQRGLNPVTMNAAHRDNFQILKRYTTSNFNMHPVSLSTRKWEKLKSMPWSDDYWSDVRNEIEDCYYSGQWYGEVATQYNTKFIDSKVLKAELNIDSNKRTVLLFPHIFWDATFFWGEDIFEDYETWFRESVRIAWTTPNVNWIIKIHPANLIKNLRDGKDIEFSEIGVIREFGELPSHIHVISAETNISTLSLYSIGDVCLTVRGTVGIEAAAFGLSVITAGTGRYDQLGFTIDVKTKDEYYQLLKNIDNLNAASDLQIELARKYAYGTFLDRPLEMDSINFFYSKTRDATLEVSISDDAKSNIFNCKDVKIIKSWFESENEDPSEEVLNDEEVILDIPNYILPSDFLNDWLSNDYLSDYPKDKIEFNKYYKRYLYGGFLHHSKISYDQNLEPVIKIIKSMDKIPRLLDVGSGTGTDGLFLSQLGCDVTGIEIFNSMRSVAETRLSICKSIYNASFNCKFEKSSLFDYENEEGFDIIYLHQVFHHLEPRDRVIEKIYSLLKPSGYIVISEVNYYNFFMQLSLAWERYREFSNPFKTIIRVKDESGIEVLWGHERLIPLFRLRKLLLNEGLHNESSYYFKFLPNKANLAAGEREHKPFLHNNLTPKIELWINKYAPRFLKRLISFQYNIIVRKA
jgi:SAM-dependent methyltransferase